ncbi:MAG: (Fe-S)-binding protein [Candidatus Hodarchaeales archaeon]|jgi:glycolate oxidase
MKSKNEILDYLKWVLEGENVLTDVEDCYVYSFEKIFMKQAYSKLDIVIKVSSSKETQEILKWAESEGISIIKRGTKSFSALNKNEKPLILIDDVKIPTLDSFPDTETKNNEIPKNVHSLDKTGYNINWNHSIAINSYLQKKMINKCNQCTTCSDYCTVTPSYNGIETWSAKGRSILIRGVMKGDLSYSKKVVDILFTCSKCGRCFAQCFQNIDVHKAIISARNQIAKKNMVPEVFLTTVKNIIENGDPSPIPVNRRLSWMKALPVASLSEKADNLYWVGCMVANRTPKTAKAFYNILNQSKVDFTLLRENEGCCGYVLLSAGLWNEAEKVAKAVIEKVENIQAKNLITPCAGCYYTFTKLYPEILDVSLPCKIYHSTQYIERMIKKGDLSLKPLDLQVTYHDPCSLGRHCNVYDSPRTVLNAITNVKLVEMPLSRNLTRCCGGGGGLWTFNHRVSMETAHIRLKEDFKKCNTDILTTACPLCQLNFRFTSRKNSISLTIKDITEIVESAMVK